MTKYILIFAILFSQFACAQNPEAKVAAKSESNTTVQNDADEGHINWMTFNEAIEAQQKEPKKIIIDFYTKWCGPCKMLDKNTFQNPSVANYINENFYAVKFNAEGNEVVNFKDKEFTNPNYVETNGRGAQHQFTQAFGVNAYPTVLILDENSNLITPIKGYVGVKDIEPTLKVIASDDYKTIQSKEQWDAWMADSFTSTFQ